MSVNFMQGYSPRSRRDVEHAIKFSGPEGAESWCGVEVFEGGLTWLQDGGFACQKCLAAIRKSAKLEASAASAAQPPSDASNRGDAKGTK